MNSKDQTKIYNLTSDWPKLKARVSPPDKGKYSRAHVTDKAREKLPFARKIILIVR